MKIIITRPYLSALKSKEDLDNLGFDTVICPMLKIDEIDFNKEINFDKYDLIIFSSQEAARIFIKYYNYTDKEIYVVGSKAKSLLMQNGFENITKTYENVGFLKNELVKNCKGKKILYPCGEDITEDFLDSNLEIDLLKIYKAEYINNFDLGIQNLIKNDDKKLIIFLSMRTANNFINLLDKYGYIGNISNISAICLSNKIKDTISEFNWNDLIVADKPNFSAIINILNKKAFT